MKLKEKRLISSTVFYVAAIVTAIIGTGLLINNVILYSKNVTQYVAQGYAVDTVISQLLPSQLIPGVCEPIALYGGIALLLVAAGIINKKVSKCFEALTLNEVILEEVTIQPEITSEETPEQVVETFLEENTVIEEANEAIEGNK